MKINIPFLKQVDDTDCGIVSLSMILKYFKISSPRKRLEELSGKARGLGLATIQLAITAARLGLKVEFFTTSLGYNPEHEKLEFYKKYSDFTNNDPKKWNAEAKALGISLNEKSISLNQILSKFTKDTIPLVLLDWNVIHGIENKYQGHFVPIAGFIDANILIHNQGKANPKAFLSINRDLFNRARAANGTDQDIIFISKKEKIQGT